MDEHQTTSHSDARRGQVSTAAAEIYDEFFVPALFGQFVEPVLDRAGVRAGSRVLDVGCGTGIVARAARRRVAPTGSVTAVDPNEGMLAVARRSESSVDWRSGSAESLPVDDRSVDRTVSQFAAMFFTDPVRAVSEMARVTATGGTVTVTTWAALDRSPGYDAMVSLIADELGSEPAEAIRVPFALGRRDDLRRLLDPIGGELVVEEVDGTARFASVLEWVHVDVRGWTLAEMIDDEAEARLVDRAERELERFVTADGSVAFPTPALMGTVVVER